jgi:hypothetical protein
VSLVDFACQKQPTFRKGAKTVEAAFDFPALLV